MTTDTAWDAFREWWATISDLSGVGSLLGWDRETDMPPGGAEGRASQMGTLAAIRHRELTRPDVEEPIALLAEADLDPRRAAAVRQAGRDRRRALCVPEDLVRAVSEAGSRCVTAWIDARPRADFDAVAPLLERVVELKRRQAEALLPEGGEEPYDALLEGFEPGARASALEPLFARLTERLTPLVARASSDGPGIGGRTWPRDAQMTLADRIARRVGFDLEHGAIAESAHPFTVTPGPGDVRFTTRLFDDDPLPGALAAMHELGHALYEQGFDPELARGPLAEAPSLGAHESQSRFWENHVGRTDAFWRLMAPTLAELFPEATAGLEPEAPAAAARVVRPSLIRVEADEVTYNLHIALRARLELALIRGDLAVADLPGAWDEGMEELLGLRPPDPRDGVMQDIHWHDGLIGYFPTYTLGNLYAAQLAEAIEAELGPLPALIEEDRLGEVLGWLREHVHRHGAEFSAADLMRRATGRDLDEDALIAHLEATYVG
jgi:carboxypeptidase Taq